MYSRTCGFTGIDPVSHRQKHIPLAQMSAHTTILASVSRTTLTQTFVNSLGDLPEIRYSFPLYDGVSVVGFTGTIGDRVITGVVKEKEQARQVYNEAVARGETAGLLAQVPDASDCFTTTIGNIPSGAEIKVEIVYIGELKHDAQIDGVRFTIPTTIAPRYGAYHSEMAEPLREGSISITVDAEVPSGSHITSIQSPSHQLAVTLGRLSTTPDAEPSFQKASATLSLGTAQLMTDFVLQVKATNTGEPVAVLEEHPTIPKQRAMMVTLVPKFELPLQKPEIVFMCDRSGSMGGKEENLKTALRIFVKSMRPGMKFNICSFGSRHDFLWKRSQPYNQTTVKEAMRHIDTISANYGGTEMFQAVEDIFARRYKDMNLEVFLITDGEIWQQGPLFEMIDKHVNDSNGAIRLFSLGIGSGASHSLIEGVARAGQGFSQSVADGEEMGSKVVRMLKGALFPHVKDYSLELVGGAAAAHDDDFEMIEKDADRSTAVNSAPSPATITDEPAKPSISLFDQSAGSDTQIRDAEFETLRLPEVHAPKVLQAPCKIPPLFPFSRTSVYLLLSADTPAPTSVVLRGTSFQGPLKLEIPVTVLCDQGETIHQLAARKAVGELEEGRGWLYAARDDNDGQLLKEKYDGLFQDLVQREAVGLGVRYQVGGKWCSFVATESNGGNHAKPPSPPPAPPAQAMSADQLQAAQLQHSGPQMQMQMAQMQAMPAVPRRAAPQQQMQAGQAQPQMQAGQSRNLFAGQMTGQMTYMPSPGSNHAIADPGSAMSLQQVLAAQHQNQSANAIGRQLPDRKRMLVNKAVPAAPAPAAWAPSTDKLQDLVVLQDIEGYWSWGSDGKLSAVLGVDEQKIMGALVGDISAVLGASGDVFATVCVLAWLGKYKADEKDTWELLADKAVDWLKEAVGESKAQEYLAAIPLVEKCL
ncbi:von Willebrand factor type A domain-containing protein [Pestalotiopsis sp. NC0098]|nr:von Willebrand factor type A domain-containing protein [Pestalotiopsis sp. NC0098]